MSESRLLPEAEAELDGIWMHVARDSGSVDVATRAVERVTERFWLLARHPYMGRRVTTCGPEAIMSSSTGLWRNKVVLILHVVHGSRNIAALSGQ